MTHWFSDRFAHKVILTGGLENLERANAMERACPGVINLTGKTTLAETASLLCLAKLLLTTDTGIMHLGFAVDCPLVCLFHDLCPGQGLPPTGSIGALRRAATQAFAPATATERMRRGGHLV